MTNSTNNRIRKYVAGGILAVAAVFGGALGSAGVGFAAPPADGWDPRVPVAPAVEAPAPMSAPKAPAPAEVNNNFGPTVKAPSAPTGKAGDN